MQTNFWSMQPLRKIQKQIHELFSCCWQKDKIQTAFAQGTRKLINTIQKERNRLLRSNISYRPYANVDYEKIYKKVVEMDPSMEEFIDEEREIELPEDEEFDVEESDVEEDSAETEQEESEDNE